MGRKEGGREEGRIYEETERDKDRMKSEEEMKNMAKNFLNVCITFGLL